jgi:hypothetical protein
MDVSGNSGTFGATDEFQLLHLLDQWSRLHTVHMESVDDKI